MLPVPVPVLVSLDGPLVVPEPMSVEPVLVPVPVPMSVLVLEPLVEPVLVSVLVDDPVAVSVLLPLPVPMSVPLLVPVPVPLGRLVPVEPVDDGSLVVDEPLEVEGSVVVVDELLEPAWSRADEPMEP